MAVCSRWIHGVAPTHVPCRACCQRHLLADIDLMPCGALCGGLCVGSVWGSWEKVGARLAARLQGCVGTDGGERLAVAGPHVCVAGSHSRAPLALQGMQPAGVACPIHIAHAHTITRSHKYKPAPCKRPLGTAAF